MSAEKTAPATGAYFAGERAPLIERERELAAIGSTLSAAEEGAGSVLVLEGEAGTGKTRLLEEAQGLARERGVSVLSARASELERGFAFGIIRQLFERRLREASETERAELLAGAAAPLAPLLGGPAPARPPPQDQLFALFHGLYWLSAQLAEERALLLAVDDLQWGDQPSQRALTYIAARAAELPLALALAFRSGEPTPAANPRALAGSASAAISIRLGPLSERGAARMLESLLGSVEPDFAAAAHRASRGNPHLLHELAATTASEGLAPDERGAERLLELASPAAGAWVRARLARLGDEAERLARSLAVLERSPVELAAAHAELTEPEAQAAADRLCDAGIFERTLPLRFAHPLLREALYHELAPAARSAAHARAAELLHERAAAETIASHLLLCEPVSEAWASEALRAAAVLAAARGSPSEAARLLRRALAEPGAEQDAPLLVELGSAEAALVDSAAREHLEAAIAITSEPLLRAGARGALSNLAWMRGEFGPAFEEMRRALGELAPGTGDALEAQLLIGLTPGRAVPELIDGVLAELQVSRLGPGGAITPGELARRTAVGFNAAFRGERALAEEALLTVVGAALDASQDDLSLWFTLAGYPLCWLGRYDEAEALAVKALESARRRGSAVEVVVAHELDMALAFCRGEVARLLAGTEKHLAFAQQTGVDDVLMVPTLVFRACGLIGRGEPDEAERSLVTAAEVEERLQGAWGWVYLPYGHSLVAAARGRWPEALEQALLCGERAVALQAPSQDWVPSRFVAARAAAKLGDRERGISIATEELEWARRTDSVRVEGMALLTLGTIGSGDEAIEMLGEAVEMLDRADVELERARARVELGMALRRCRRPSDAREPLREALEIAAQTGATVLAERARSELQAAGGRPRRERLSGLEALTPREREIAGLAAGELSNREIAERLFVSRKTIEAHLRTVFRKLEIGSRGELSEALAGP